MNLPTALKAEKSQLGVMIKAPEFVNSSLA